MKLSEIEQKKDEFNEKIKQLLLNIIRDEVAIKEKLVEHSLSLDRKRGCSFYLTKIEQKNGTLSKNYYLYASVYLSHIGNQNIYLGSTKATEEDRSKLLELSILFEQLERRMTIASTL